MTTRAARRDDGFTLIEMLVAIGVFTVLMGMVTTVVVQGMRVVRDLTTATEIQSQQQNALIWMTRLLRYADNPVEGSSPWVLFGGMTADVAGNADLTFTTFSGTGPVDRVPYWVRIRVNEEGDLVSTITTPQTVNGYAGICWFPSDASPCAGITPASTTRVLVRASTGHRPTLRIDYFNKSGVATDWRTVTAADWPAWAAGVSKVNLAIGDTGSASRVEQTINLANPR